MDTLARWGFTGLWLIGIWERSAASKRVKQMCGNPEAESSAYSLYDYQIANDLGGAEAYERLKERCAKRGIRLGSTGQDRVEERGAFVTIDDRGYYVAIAIVVIAIGRKFFTLAITGGKVSRI